MSNLISTSAPKPDAKEYAYAILRGVVSSAPIPFASGVAAELMSLIFAEPLAKRQEEWITSLAEELVKLRDKVDGFRLDTLSDNASFVTSVLHATQIALRSHQKEKLNALRNAILHSALPSAPDDNYQSIFLRLIDELTPLHVEILQFLYELQEKYEKLPDEMKKDVVLDIDSLREFLQRPSLSDLELYEAVFKDLDTHKLANIQGLSKTGFHVSFVNSRLTKMGEMFINYIKDPELF